MSVDDPSFISKLWEKHVAILDQHPPKKTFQDWIHLGQKFAQLAAGGTIYVLLIIASLNLRWCIRKASWRTVSDLGKMLRVPVLSPWNPTEESMLITQCIIPMISRLREEFPLRLCLDTRILDCTILRQSYLQFDALKVK
ncbi:hypothetical protein SCLCIDRAFT_119613 [Scleroderma citrinum Foug A]|uniref:Uncharacterized protein n=1 Tax=Scleroderma citrinum Foug A TaxID=1036808 RepID=A0A0C3DNQ0_9AGAM|nr:hypothetical protein SCLCIDRAFT_119613 [Scleroderma citrinum Foug A]